MAYIELSLPRFIKKFSTEEACLQAISAARWPRGFVCPRCGHHGGTRLTERRSMQCWSCRRQTSITSSTLFHGSHIPLVKWFLAIYLVAQDKGGISTKRLAKHLEMHYATAWSLLHRIRFAMGIRDENLTLAGYIELDEAFFGGKRRNKRTRKGPKKPSEKKKTVFIMVESEGSQAGNLVMRVVDNSTLDSLKPIVAQKVEADPPGQMFRGAAWQAHDVVMQFGHTIEMSHIPNDQQDAELPCLSLAITHAKRFLLGTCHQFCKKHLQRYLDEFCYRWNRRHLERELASHLITACTLAPRMPILKTA
jgi:hypothetical protein